MEQFNDADDLEDGEEEYVQPNGQDLDDDDGEEQINSKSTAEASGDKFDPLGGPLAKKMDVIDTSEESAAAKAAAAMNINVIAAMTVDVPSFTERKEGGATVVFFNVVLGFQKNNKSWTVPKRYSEFDALDKFLKEHHPNMPTLPGKTLFKLSEAKAIEDRRKVLSGYLKTLINRKDMRSSLQFRKFLAFEANFPQSLAYEAKKIGVMQDFQKGVRDVIYMPQYNTALVACSEMNIVSRMDSYFTNVSHLYFKF